MIKKIMFVSILAVVFVSCSSTKTTSSSNTGTSTTTQKTTKEDANKKLGNTPVTVPATKEPSKLQRQLPVE